jgi:hypothetical protein
MAITTYAQLQTAVGDNLARSDLTTFIPDFVTMAENWLNYGSENSPALRCREMETTVTLPTVSGVATLPADYLEYSTVREDTSRALPLDFLTPDKAAAWYPSGSSGVSGYFTISGSSLSTYPLTTNSLVFSYYQALPPLASNSTNWLLTKAPGVYLRATLIQAAEFIKNDEEAAKQATMAKALVAGMNRSDMIGKYKRAGLSLRGVNP